MVHTADRTERVKEEEKKYKTKRKRVRIHDVQNTFATRDTIVVQSTHVYHKHHHPIISISQSFSYKVDRGSAILSERLS